jgi:hypothetical protein
MFTLVAKSSRNCQESIMGDQKQNPGFSDQEKKRENERAGERRDQGTGQGAERDRERASNAQEKDEPKRTPGMNQPDR